MAAKSKKAARPGYYACGKKKPENLGGTPELIEKKRDATGSDQGEMTPLGILAGRGLVSEDQLDAARRFKFCHDVVWNEIGGPRLGSGTLSWVASDMNDEDAERLARRQQAEPREARLDRNFRLYNGYRNTMSAAYWELLHWAAVYSESSGWHSYGWLEHQIRAGDLRWIDGRIVAAGDRLVLPATKETLLAIRNVLQAVAGTIASGANPVRRHDGESFARFSVDGPVA